MDTELRDALVAFLKELTELAKAIRQELKDEHNGRS